MMEILQHWAEEAFANMFENPTLQSRHCIEYAHKVLYPVVSSYFKFIQSAVVVSGLIYVYMIGYYYLDL